MLIKPRIERNIAITILPTGAVFVENESGYRKVIDSRNTAQRESLAKTLLTSSSDAYGSGTGGAGGGGGGGGTKFVYRHLINGDPMLLNRQPTLHKPSIMSHKYAACRLVQLELMQEIYVFFMLYE